MPRRSRRDDDDELSDGDGVDAAGSSGGAGAGSLPVTALMAKTGNQSMLASVMRGVVKVFTTHCKPNFAQPWAMKPPLKSTSSGFLITYAGKRLVVTNAHSVAYATLVQVRKQGDSDKATARVLAAAHDCDLAILSVDDAKFWKNAPTLEFGTLPNLHDNVMVVGYPLGGEQISVTTGVISRIDYGMYSFSTRDHLVLQTDSAINSGNSGGPCFSAETGKVVGVAFQSLTEAENVGYVVPVDILKHVLEDFKRTGRANGFGRIGFQYQGLENDHLKAFFKLPPGVGGILITRVSPVGPLVGAIQERDVLVALDGQPIADDGTVAFPGRSEERISFGYLLTYKFIGDPVVMSIIRGGKRLSITVPCVDIPDLVPHSLHDSKPSYVVYAGLVLTPLSEPYLGAMYGRDWDAKGPVRLVYQVYHGLMEAPGQQVVVLSSILNNSLVVGYDETELVGLPLLSVDGTKVNNLTDAARLITGGTHPLVNLEFADKKLIVLPRGQAEAMTAEVLATHAIPAPISDDLVQALQQTTGGPKKAAAKAAAGGAGAAAASSSSTLAAGSKRKAQAAKDYEPAARKSKL